MESSLFFVYLGSVEARKSHQCQDVWAEFFAYCFSSVVVPDLMRGYVYNLGAIFLFCCHNIFLSCFLHHFHTFNSIKPTVKVDVQIF